MVSPPSFLLASLYVIIGGAFGSWMRFLVGRAALFVLGPEVATMFPWATLFVNVVGSFAMGLLVGWLSRHGVHRQGTQLLLGVGVLGGFTTFSSFTMELVLFADRGAIGMGLLYAAVSLFAGIAGMFLGLVLVRSLA